MSFLNDLYDKIYSLLSLYIDSGSNPTDLNSLPSDFLQITDTVYLQAYSGTWYEIARYQAPFEFFLDNVTAEYTIQSDGTLKVVNKGSVPYVPFDFSVDGKAYSTDCTNKNLKVSFKDNDGDYNIIMLGPKVNCKYSYSVVSGGDYLWILSRTSVLPEKDEIVSRLQTAGFNTNNFYYTKHH